MGNSRLSSKVRPAVLGLSFALAGCAPDEYRPCNVLGAYIKPIIEPVEALDPADLHTAPGRPLHRFTFRLSASHHCSKFSDDNRHPCHQTSFSLEQWQDLHDLADSVWILQGAYAAMLRTAENGNHEGLVWAREEHGDWPFYISSFFNPIVYDPENPIFDAPMDLASLSTYGSTSTVSTTADPELWAQEVEDGLLVVEDDLVSPFWGNKDEGHRSSEFKDIYAYPFEYRLARQVLGEGASQYLPDSACRQRFFPRILRPAQPEITWKGLDSVEAPGLTTNMVARLNEHYDEETRNRLCGPSNRNTEGDPIVQCDSENANRITNVEYGNWQTELGMWEGWSYGKRAFRRDCLENVDPGQRAHFIAPLRDAVTGEPLGWDISGADGSGRNDEGEIDGDGIIDVEPRLVCPEDDEHLVLFEDDGRWPVSTDNSLHIEAVPCLRFDPTKEQAPAVLAAALRDRVAALKVDGIISDNTKAAYYDEEKPTQVASVIPWQDPADPNNSLFLMGYGFHGRQRHHDFIFNIENEEPYREADYRDDWLCMLANTRFHLRDDPGFQGKSWLPNWATTARDINLSSIFDTYELKKDFLLNSLMLPGLWDEKWGEASFWDERWDGDQYTGKRRSAYLKLAAVHAISRLGRPAVLWAPHHNYNSVARGEVPLVDDRNILGESPSGDQDTPLIFGERYSSRSLERAMVHYLLVLDNPSIHFQPIRWDGDRKDLDDYRSIPGFLRAFVEAETWIGWFLSMRAGEPLTSYAGVTAPAEVARPNDRAGDERPQGSSRSLMYRQFENALALMNVGREDLIVALPLRDPQYYDAPHLGAGHHDDPNNYYYYIVEPWYGRCATETAMPSSLACGTGQVISIEAARECRALSAAKELVRVEQERLVPSNQPCCHDNGTSRQCFQPPACDAICVDKSEETNPGVNPDFRWIVTRVRIPASAAGPATITVPANQAVLLTNREAYPGFDDVADMVGDVDLPDCARDGNAICRKLFPEEDRDPDIFESQEFAFSWPPDPQCRELPYHFACDPGDLD